MTPPLLLVGEVFLDCRINGTGPPVQIGGIAHAARALSALDKPFGVAAVCPSYLQDDARNLFSRLGCADFIPLGEVSGSPNIVLISDPVEAGDPGYDNILRSRATVRLSKVSRQLEKYRRCLVFPGRFDLEHVVDMMSPNVELHLDIAYDIPDVASLAVFRGSVGTVFLSTSSDLFRSLGSGGVTEIDAQLSVLDASTFVLKENRGGARVMDRETTRIVGIPAQIVRTLNSIGVGDAFSAAFVSLLDEGVTCAGWRSSRVAAAYAQTLSLQDFRCLVSRSLLLSVEEMRGLGGVYLPWEARPEREIYLAAPDFSYGDRRAIDLAVRCLEYHNFRVRRPVLEVGELQDTAKTGERRQVYDRDVELLRRCSLVFAIPTRRDPGTLVEVGMAVNAGTPVVVYDPENECDNNMLTAGTRLHSRDIGACIDEVFCALSDTDPPVYE